MYKSTNLLPQYCELIKPTCNNKQNATNISKYNTLTICTPCGGILSIQDLTTQIQELLRCFSVCYTITPEIKKICNQLIIDFKDTKIRINNNIKPLFENPSFRKLIIKNLNIELVFGLPIFALENNKWNTYNMFIGKCYLINCNITILNQLSVQSIKVNFGGIVKNSFVKYIEL
jgi:hypothetical protein